MFAFYGEGLLAPRPTPKLGDHPLSFVRGVLFNIFTANLQLEDFSSIRNPRKRHTGRKEGKRGTNKHMINGDRSRERKE
jgi:hypothetical protein